MYADVDCHVLSFRHQILPQATQEMYSGVIIGYLV